MPRASRNYNLQIINPRLAEEWHLTRNGSLTANDVRPYSHKKVWWICSQNHEWLATVKERSYGNNCPYCSGKRVCDDNSLKAINPKLAKQWHPIKNGSLTPRNVTPGSNKKVWWICKKGHEWKAVINNRVKGRDCPYCSGKKVTSDNCLQTTDPHLAREWHAKRHHHIYQ